MSKNVKDFDFAAWFDAKANWSRETFGPGDRYQGVVAHIRKELDEVAAAPSDLEEWVDVALLAMDGAWRSAGASGADFLAAMLAKDAKNRARTWPDWRTLKPDQVSEHVETQWRKCMRCSRIRECDGSTFVCRYCLVYESTPVDSPYDPGEAVEWVHAWAADWRDMTPADRDSLVISFWDACIPRQDWSSALVASALEAGGLIVPPSARGESKDLVNWVAEHGRWVVSPDHVDEFMRQRPTGMVRPGDVICWKRHWWRRAHVAIIGAERPNGGLWIIERDQDENIASVLLDADEWPTRRRRGLAGLYGIARP